MYHQALFFRHFGTNEVQEMCLISTLEFQRNVLEKSQLSQISTKLLSLTVHSVLVTFVIDCSPQPQLASLIHLPTCHSMH